MPEHVVRLGVVKRISGVERQAGMDEHIVVLQLQDRPDSEPGPLQIVLLIKCKLSNFKRLRDFSFYLTDY
jgi:hypothetical protein